jgi:hypothetical protein
MTICPVALVASCRKCPAFAACPLKSVIGDYKPEAQPPPNPEREDAERKTK